MKQENWLNTGGGNPTIRYTYDNFGNLIEVLDPLGRVTKYDYGLLDETNTYPERVTNALGHATTYTYDFGIGNFLTETKNGITKTNVYDVFGRIVKEILPYDTEDFPTKSYTYNFDGTAPEFEIVRQRTTANNTIDIYYYYDGFANLVQIKSPDGDNNNQIVKNIFYDGLFRVKEEQNPFFYNSNINLTSITNQSNKTKYQYDALGRITKVINPDGTTKITAYSRQEINDYDENENRHAYMLDAYNRIIAVTEYNTDYYLLTNETYNTTYTYSGADELTGIRDIVGNFFNFSYDSVGRKIKLLDPDLGVWTYTYDLVGNLISQVGGGGNLISGDNYYREYNGLGQLKSIKEGNNSNGRLLEEYFYDANNDRIKVNRYSYSGGTNETIYTLYKEWMQIRNSSGIYNFYYVYQDGVLVSRLNADGSKYYYHSDHLGSTTLITDESGTVVEDEFYSPYGESLTSNEAEQFKLYTGQFKDNTGQYYFGARYYIPPWRIFIQCDKIKPDVFNPQALNCYVYGLNNPFRYVDIGGRVYWDKVAEASIQSAGSISSIAGGIGLMTIGGLAETTSLGTSTVIVIAGVGITTYGFANLGESIVDLSAAFREDVEYFKKDRGGIVVNLGTTLTEGKGETGFEILDFVLSGSTFKWNPKKFSQYLQNIATIMSESLTLQSISSSSQGTPNPSSNYYSPKVYIIETSGGGSYTTTNPYWKPGTGNKAGTGYGGGGGYSDFIPDPSGREDKYGNPIYVPVDS